MPLTSAGWCKNRFFNLIILLLNFSQQEPGGTDEEILNGIRYVRPGNDFQTNITLFRKIDVNGANEHPLYSYLKVSDAFLLSSRRVTS
jgi:glutathione peroxidase-family protein